MKPRPRRLCSLAHSSTASCCQTGNCQESSGCPGAALFPQHQPVSLNGGLGDLAELSEPTSPSCTPEAQLRMDGVTQAGSASGSAGKTSAGAVPTLPHLPKPPPRPVSSLPVGSPCRRGPHAFRILVWCQLTASPPLPALLCPYEALACCCHMCPGILCLLCGLETQFPSV